MDDVIANVMKETESLGEILDYSGCTSTDLVCLNFKVPMRLRQQFKIYAARHNMTMTELLLRLIDDCLTSGGTRGLPSALIKQEIKK
jgi:hypothetical protein